MPIHPLWIVAILVIVLIIFGPGRLPELGSAVGKAMREFRKATSELTNEVNAAARAEPLPTPPPAPAETADTAGAKGSESSSSSNN
jgi:sec-independent protein translocase protein TatA